MADFMYLFRGANPEELGFSPEQMQEHMQKWGAWMEDLTKQGKFKGGEPLVKGGKFVSGKEKAVTDGPYTESKDLIGGYLLVTADSLDDATELSKTCPIFEDGGSLEVREIRKLEAPA